ncbi:MAG: FHA domain-containing protein [Myxococcales bacterium]|nr:FHA domain-containing protein [Myxococcales bacterium]
MQTGPLSLPSVNTGGDIGPHRFPAGAYRANLYVYDPFGRIDWYALAPQSFAEGRYFTIGRGADCDIALDDGAVSSRHAFIAAEDGELILRDLRSTNGTTVNGEPLTEHMLQHGDVIRLGATDIRFLFSLVRSPVQLVLDFTEGQNAGKSVATYGASTHIGRFNCAINLAGDGVAAQHARVDAFGEELIYVVSLHPDNETWLNGERVVGIAPARQGDVLRVGEHAIVLRVVEGDAEDVPRGEGTLQVGQGEGGTAHDPVARVSASQIARLEAHLRDHQPERQVQVSTAPPTAFAPPPARAHAEAAVVAELAAARPAAAAPPRRRRGLWLLLLLPALAAGLVVGAWVVKLPRATVLTGEVVGSDAQAVPLKSPLAGRVDAVSVAVGGEVAVGQAVAVVVDAAAEARLAIVAEQIKGLEAQPQVERVVAAPVPSELLRALRIAEQEREDTAIAVASAQRAFERREMTLDQVEAAKERAERARREVYAVQARVDEARSRRTVVKEGGPSEADYQHIERLVAEREALQKRLKVPVLADEAGRVARLTVEPGAVVVAGQALAELQQGQTRRGLRLHVPHAQVQPVEAAGAGTLRAPGIRPLTVTLGTAAVRADADGTFPMDLPLPAVAEGELGPGTTVEVEVALPEERALLALWRRARGLFD